MKCRVFSNNNNYYYYREQIRILEFGNVYRFAEQMTKIFVVRGHGLGSGTRSLPFSFGCKRNHFDFVSAEYAELRLCILRFRFRAGPHRHTPRYSGVHCTCTRVTFVYFIASEYRIAYSDGLLLSLKLTRDTRLNAMAAEVAHKCMSQRLNTTFVQRYGLTEHLQGIVCNTFGGITCVRRPTKHETIAYRIII